MTDRFATVTPVNRFAGVSPKDLSEGERQSVVALALAVLKHECVRGTKITNPREVCSYVRLRLAGRPNEVFGALFLDAKHRVIETREIFQGSIDAAIVHPRLVLQEALELNAAAVVVFHNHPSGDSEPSRNDIELTRRLRDALALIDVRLLDHIVVSAMGAVSLAERREL